MLLPQAHSEQDLCGIKGFWKPLAFLCSLSTVASPTRPLRELTTLCTLLVTTGGSSLAQPGV